MISRPSYHLSSRLLLAALAILAALVLLWVVSQNRHALARELPDSARWYARLPLPRASRWYDSFLPWQQAMGRASAAGEFVASLDVLHWEGAAFARDILPLISGSLEVAELADGQVVLAAERGAVVRGKQRLGIRIFWKKRPENACCGALRGRVRE